MSTTELPAPGRILLALGLGSNLPRGRQQATADLDPRRLALEGALPGLRAGGLEILAASPLFETEPLDVGPDHGPFLNAALLVDAPADLRRVLSRTEELERLAGRDRKGRGAPRLLDIDLLAAWGLRPGGGLVALGPLAQAGLELPHPRLFGRAFVLEPLAAIAGGLEVPSASGLASVAALAARLGAPPLAPGPPSPSFPGGQPA